MLTLLWYTNESLFEKKIPKNGSHFQQKKKKKKSLGPFITPKKKKKLKKNFINILPEQSLKLGTFSCQNDP